nr:hypothetical protein [Sphingomonas sp. CDS-1]
MDKFRPFFSLMLLIRNKLLLISVFGHVDREFDTLPSDMPPFADFMEGGHDRSEAASDLDKSLWQPAERYVATLIAALDSSR